jgi:hypothetical protein
LPANTQQKQRYGTIYEAPLIFCTCEKKAFLIFYIRMGKLEGEKRKRKTFKTNTSYDQDY